MKITKEQRFSSSALSLTLLAVCLAGFPANAFPPGPTPVVPVGGGPPGAFPNTSVSAVNVVAKGSASGFTGDVEITGFEGQGPIRWTINRYNRGDFAMRLAPANPAGADGNTLNKGFIQFNGANDAALAENQSWRPNALLGVAIPTARQNGPINWGDGEGDFYPTVAIGAASSGYGYSMTDGSFGNGQLDIEVGRAGTHATSPEGNASFSVAWFPYDAGWIAGNMGNPADPSTGAPQWNEAGQHSAGLTPGLMTWSIPPSPPGDGATYGGLGQLRLPGVNAETSGMLFTTSSHGNSDVNIVGVAPINDLGTGDSGWLVTVREDSALTGDEVASGGQFQFEFVYVPYNAQNLIGGYINGSTGAKIQSAGTYAVARTSTGTYELSIPGKTGTSGTLVLQVADLEAGTTLPMASRAFLSYQYNSGTGKFIIQSRKATTDTVSDLADANFYVAWVDFLNPLAPPVGPRVRSKEPVVVSAGTGNPGELSPKEGNIAVNTDEPEVLVTTIDENNSGAYIDPTTGNPAVQSLIGYFYDPRTLTLKRGPFFIMGNANGQITRHDVKYNPVSHQYNVVGNARTYDPAPADLIMIARVNPDSIAGVNDPLVNVFVYDGLANTLSYDDVSIAVSPKNGNFIVVAEHKVASEGEGVYGALFSSSGAVLTPTPSRLDLAPVSGSSDEDDPDVVYLPRKDVFLYVSNTDNNGLVNKIVGSVVQTTPSGGNLQISGAEQLLSPGTGTQGHPASFENPFNGEILTAYDGGNGTSIGKVSYYTIGAGPAYSFTSVRPEISYLAGSGSNPFTQQHPQFAADPDSGVIVLGHYANGSSVGYPNAYVFSLLDTDGALLPSQLSIPYFLADSVAGPVDTGPDYHNVKYDRFSDSFIAVFTGGGSPTRVTYLTALSVTSSYLAPPTLTITRSGANAILRWPATAVTYTLKATSSLTSPSWLPVGGTPNQVGAQLELTVPVSGNKFYRLEK